MSYKDKYRSIQLNISKEKYADLLKWLDEKVDEEARSINSFVIMLLKKEFIRDGKREKYDT